jgi:hypothetical protein
VEEDVIGKARRRSPRPVVIGVAVVVLVIAVVILLAEPLSRLVGDYAADAVGPTMSEEAPSGEPLIWNLERAEPDWPLPVRPEPPGAPILVTLEPAPSTLEQGVPPPLGFPSFTDPSGDIGAFGPGWLDITTVWVHFTNTDPMSSSRVDFDLAVPAPPEIPHPRERWVAYGMVVDVDGDGRADLRLGMDNAPRGQHRAWNTDLASGVTGADTGRPYGMAGEMYWDTWYPGEETSGRMHFNGQDLGDAYFYIWASLIADGRVVATDYAPDGGWIDPND